MTEDYQPTASGNSHYPFLQGGGEMGQLTRSFDWARTSLGPPDAWPQSLRTTLGILLHSAFPMFLFWGDELTCFYNDAYRPSLGHSGKHPAIGDKGREVWSEIWSFVGPLIEQVVQTGEPVWLEDQLFPLQRNGKLDAVYWTCGYSPAFGDDGRINGVLITCMETTKMVASRKKTEESEQYFRHLTDTVPAIIWETEPDGYCTYLNKRWYDYTGQTEDQAKGFGWLDATHPDDKEEAGKCFLDANARQIPFNFLYRLRQKDGTYRRVIDKGSPRFDATGTYAGMIGTVVDVHEQKSAEEEVMRFKYMADNACDPFILMRQDGTFAYLNQLALDRWGYTADEARHIRVPDVDPIYDDAVFAAAFARAQAGHMPPFETLHRRKDGTVYPVEVNMGGLLLGREPHMFAVARDITERKKTEETLKESEQRFQAAVVAVQGILWTNNAIGQMDGEQPGWSALTGQSYDEYKGYGWASAVHPDDAQPTIDAWQEALANRRMFVFEHRVRTRTGTWELFSIRATPLLDVEGKIREWVGVHTNITEQRRAELAVQESEALFRNVTNSSPTGLWLSDESGSLTYLNKTLVDWTGMPYDGLLGTGWANAIVDEDRQQSAEAFLNAVAVRGHYDVVFRINKQDGHIMWCRAAGDPYYREDGSYAGYAGFCMDIDILVKQQKNIESSEARFRSLIEEAPVATCLFVGREMIIDVANEAMITVWGKTRSILGKPLADALPELQGQPFFQILDNVFTTGITYEAKDARADLQVDGVLNTFYFDYTYKPLRNEVGAVYGILNMAVDVTAQVMARLALENTQQQVLASFEQSPVGIALISRDNLTFRMANPFYGQLVGRPVEDILNKPLLDALPELQGQGFDTLLNQVLNTGVPFVADEVAFEVMRNDQLETSYVNLTYQPQQGTEPTAGPDDISGVLVVAIDVTQQVRSRRRVEESEAKLRSVVNTAPAAIGLFVGRELVVEMPNQAFIDVMGKGPDITGKTLRELMPELITENQPFLQILDDVYTSGRTFQSFGSPVDIVRQGVLVRDFYDITYAPLLNADGNVYAILEIAVQVTEQTKAKRALEDSEQRYRTLSADLDQQVQVRTQQLQESVNDLVRSNQNLQQFAYVASHDLQEPLRKIQSFGDLLQSQYADKLGAGVDHLQRMQLAASRMSTLIKDLLTFSRISTRQETTESVSLSEVVQSTLSNLEIAISETNAQIGVAPLPTIQGDASQLGQLFQNLLSNALKFRRPDTTPIIRVSAEYVPANNLPTSVKPTRATAAYHRIDITDNGIGFDEKYVDRIFQVFQRLHGKSDFAGTGIGLAICEKVAANHGGAVTATSQPGEGATFSVYLPV